MLTGVRVLDVSDLRVAACGSHPRRSRRRRRAGRAAGRRSAAPPGALPRRPSRPGAQPHLARAQRQQARHRARSRCAEPDRERFRALARAADVLIESDAPGAMAARGLGYEQLARENSRLVYCAVTPFGQSGPYAQHPRPRPRDRRARRQRPHDRPRGPSARALHPADRLLPRRAGDGARDRDRAVAARDDGRGTIRGRLAPRDAAPESAVVAGATRPDGTHDAPQRRTHGTSARDLARRRRRRLLRPARRTDPHPQPARLRRLDGGVRRGARLAARLRLGRLQPQHAERRRDRAPRAGLRRVLRQAHATRALRRRARAPHPAGALQRRRRDPRPRAAARARAVRARRAPGARRVARAAGLLREDARPRDPHPPARAARGRAPGRGAARVDAGDAARASPRPQRRARAPAAGALAGIRVLELGSGAAGPVGDALLRRARRRGDPHRVAPRAGLPARAVPHAERSSSGSTARPCSCC